VGPALLLAVVFGAGKIPVPAVAVQFPDASAFVGVGLQRENNMVRAAVRETGSALLSRGPGPQQLAARWDAGTLNQAERLVVLLGGGAFHDRSLLPVYEDAIRSADLRMRQAAAVGMFTLIGLEPPLPSQLADRPEAWAQLGRLCHHLRVELRTRPLSDVWLDSYLASRGVRRPRRLAFTRKGMECVVAMREIAQPEDLPEVAAFWVLLDNEEERGVMMGTIEAITLQCLLDRTRAPRQPNGEWQVRGAFFTLDSWLENLCHPLNGWAQLRAGLERLNALGPNGEITTRSWVSAMQAPCPPFTLIPAETLVGLSGLDIAVDRQDVDSAANSASRGKLIQYFSVSAGVPLRQTAVGVESRHGKP
jgi:hypothetical protein